jgi:hypothetical protein
MRNTLRLLGIIALAVIIGFSMVACDNGTTSSTTTTEEYPVKDDYTSSSLSLSYDGTEKTVTITPKDGKSTGAVTVFYNGSTAKPVNAGSYAISFNVAASGKYRAAEGIYFGQLVINPVAGTKPVKADFSISGLSAIYNDNVPCPVSIYALPGKTNGTIIIYYTGADVTYAKTQAPPYAIGRYNVTFDVGAGTNGYDAETNLDAGQLVISEQTDNVSVPTADDFHIQGTGVFPYNALTPAIQMVTITKKEGMSSGPITIKYNGVPLPHVTEPDTYVVTFDVGASLGWGSAANLYAGILKINDGVQVSEDCFDISGLSQVFNGERKPVSIGLKYGYTNLILGNRWYEGIGSTIYVKVSTPPIDAGTYKVTFDVLGGEGYKSKEGLSAGNLVISTTGGTGTLTVDDFNITGYEETGPRNTRYNIAKPPVVSVNPKNAANVGKVTVYYERINSGIPKTTNLPVNVGYYNVTFDVGESGSYAAASNIDAGTLTIIKADTVNVLDYNVKYNGVFPYDGLAITPVEIEFLTLNGPTYVVKYNNSPSLPRNAGTYKITFDYESDPSGNWEGYSGIEVSPDLIIVPGYPQLTNYVFTAPINKVYDGAPATGVIPSQRPGSLMSGGVITFTYKANVASLPDVRSPNVPKDAATWAIYMDVDGSDRNWEATRESLALTETLVITPKMPTNDNFKLDPAATNGLLFQDAYDVKAVNFVVDTATLPLYTGTTKLNTTYWKDGRSIAANQLNAAGPGTFDLRVVLNPIQNWQGTTLSWTLEVSAREFATVAAFRAWYNNLQPGNTVYMAKFRDNAPLDAADITEIVRILKNVGPSEGVGGDEWHANDVPPPRLDTNYNKRLSLDFGTQSALDTLPAGAFTGCRNLVELDLSKVPFTTAITATTGSGLTLAGTFGGCELLKVLKLPPQMETQLPVDAFKDTVLTTLATGGAPSFATGALNGAGLRIDTLYLDAINTGTATLPLNYLKTLYVGADAEIGQKAFLLNTSITSVIFPDTYTKSIGANAFEGCNKINNVHFPETSWTGAAITIGADAFKGCVALQTVNIPVFAGSGSTIHEDAFAGANGIKNVILGGPATGTTAFRGKGNLETVKLLTGVTDVAANAFSGCSALKRVEFDTSSLVTINDGAFMGCLKLEDIPSLADVTTLGENAFNGALALKSVTLPTAIIGTGMGGTTPFTLNTGVFKGTGLESVDLSGSNFDIIATQAFQNCFSLVSVTLPATISVATLAFDNCRSLTTVGADEDLVAIGATVTLVDGAFKGCTSITDVEITSPAAGAGVTYTGKIFEGCSSLATLTVKGGATSAPVVTFNAANSVPSITNVIWAVPSMPTSVNFAGTGLQKLTIAESITTAIAATATNFPDSFDVLEIVAPQSGTDGTFSTLPATHVIIGPKSDATAILIKSTTATTAIFNTTKVKYITFVGELAATFDALTGLTDLDLTFVGNQAVETPAPNGILTNAFNGAQFKIVRLGWGINAINTNFESTATNLEAIYVTNDNDFYGNNRNDGVLYTKVDGSLASLIKYPIKKNSTIYPIPEGVTSIAASAFVGSTALTNLTIPKTMTSIGATNTWATPGLTTLTYNAESSTNGSAFSATVANLTIGDDVVDIPGTFLAANNTLTSVTIGKNVATIGDGAFKTWVGPSASAALTVYYNAEALRFSGTEGAFEGNAKIRTVVIGDDVSIISKQAFKDCTAIFGTVDFNRATTIEANAFEACATISAIIVPNTCTEIQEEAFAGTTSLTDVTIRRTNLRFGDNVFVAGTNTLEGLYASEGSLPGRFILQNAGELTAIWVK